MYYKKSNNNARKYKSNDERPRRSTRRSDYMDNTHYEYKGKPERETVEANSLMAVKALRNLPKSSYSVMADPYTASLPTSNPYPIINSFNRVAGGQFAGLQNIDGGNVQQYANGVSSEMLTIADCLKMETSINYRYLPIFSLPEGKTSYRGKQLIKTMMQSIAESMSILQSTTYTQMAINSYAVSTDLPMGDATTTKIDDVTVYTDATAVFYAMSVYYQIFWLQILNTLTWHNSFRLKQGTMIRNSWNRETPTLNSFFGLMNKKSFLSLVDSICLAFEGEYIDTDFARQAAMLNAMPSRRSNSLNDPVLELQTKYVMPSIKLYLLNSDKSGLASTKPIFNSDDLCGTDRNNNTFTFAECIERLNDYLSMEATTGWARQKHEAGDDRDRFNDINDYLQIINWCVNYFKPLWNDYREALDTTSRAGIVQWQKGFRPAVTKDTDAPLFRNLTIENIYQLLFSGSDSITLDTATSRIRSFSLWNMYTGIPEYDSKQGGIFLALSFKDLSNLESKDNLIEYLPTIMDYTESSQPKTAAITRDGHEVVIVYTTTSFEKGYAVRRLAPLADQKQLKIRIPTVRSAENSSLYADENCNAYVSNILKTLTEVFGLARVTFADGIVSFQVDSDIVSIYQIEFEDITNEAITYARAFSPFKGTTSSAGILGFFGLTSRTTK